MKRVLVCALLLLFALSAFAEQKDINRVGLFTGYSYLNTPVIGLSQHGFNASGGVNMNRWIEFGADFSVLRGDTNLGIGQTLLGPQLAPVLPLFGIPASALAGASLPINASTYTYQVGGQINIRKWQKITPFIRPVLGAMHEDVSVKLPTAGPMAALFTAVKFRSNLSDTVPMYGIGGGLDFNASKHLGLRVSIDYAHTKMFEGMLASQNNVRISVGPTFKFGSLKPALK